MITLYISKLSVGLVLFRLAEARQYVRLSLQISMGILTVWTAITVLTVALQCRPLAAAWGEGTGTCVSGTVISNTGYSYSSMDIATSWFYAVGKLGSVTSMPGANISIQLLPIYLLRDVQLSLRLKTSVIILLGLGVV